MGFSQKQSCKLLIWPISHDFIKFELNPRQPVWMKIIFIQCVWSCLVYSATTWRHTRGVEWNS